MNLVNIHSPTPLEDLEGEYQKAEDKKYKRKLDPDPRHNKEEKKKKGSKSSSKC